uniref:Uncharacterized protein n=1 Tax=Anopheles christyi TaxID=43041 RepID=A0A182KHW6_9DIPT
MIPCFASTSACFGFFNAAGSVFESDDFPGTGFLPNAVRMLSNFCLISLMNELFASLVYSWPVRIERICFGGDEPAAVSGGDDEVVGDCFCGFLFFFCFFGLSSSLPSSRGIMTDSYR